jgi:protein-tyrosine kinase
MSRIDEALARASANVAVNLPEVPRAGGAAPTFASEVSDARSVGREGSVGSNEVFPPDAQPDPHILDVDGDFQRLPAAEKLVLTSGVSTSVEQFRRLAARLYLAQSERGTRVVMVTSALAGEGKTLSAANLALTLSESYKRSVLLIDADLRRPCIHEIFQLPNLAGLNDGLRPETERRIPLVHYTDHLSILTAGRPDSDPMSVLCSDRMKHVIAEASARFDWVVVDTPPVALLSDAHVLASLVDTVLLVVQAGKTPLAAIKTAVQAVGRDRVLGVLLNRADDAFAHESYGYYENYEGARA